MISNSQGIQLIISCSWLLISFSNNPHFIYLPFSLKKIPLPRKLPKKLELKTTLFHCGFELGLTTSSLPQNCLTWNIELKLGYPTIMVYTRLSYEEKKHYHLKAIEKEA